MFGKIVREQRNHKRMKLIELARRCDMGKGHLSGVEREKVLPPKDRIVRKIAKAINVNKNVLLIVAHIDKIPKDVRKLFIEAFCDIAKLNVACDDAKNAMGVSKHIDVMMKRAADAFNFINKDIHAVGQLYLVDADNKKYVEEKRALGLTCKKVCTHNDVRDNPFVMVEAECVNCGTIWVLGRCDKCDEAFTADGEHWHTGETRCLKCDKKGDKPSTLKWR